LTCTLIQPETEARDQIAQTTRTPHLSRSISIAAIALLPLTGMLPAHVQFITGNENRVTHDASIVMRDTSANAAAAISTLTEVL